MRLCSFSLFVRLLEQKKVTFMIRFPKLSSPNSHMNFLQTPAFNDRWLSSMNIHYLKQEKWFLLPVLIEHRKKIPALLWEGKETEQKRKENVLLISENNWKATKWGICVHLFNISFFFGCKQIWINTKAKRKMYFSVKRLILNAWETFCKVLKGYFYFVVVSSRRKLGIKTR